MANTVNDIPVPTLISAVRIGDAPNPALDIIRLTWVDTSPDKRNTVAIFIGGNRFAHSQYIQPLPTTGPRVTDVVAHKGFQAVQLAYEFDTPLSDSPGTRAFGATTTPAARIS